VLARPLYLIATLNSDRGKKNKMVRLEVGGGGGGIVMFVSLLLNARCALPSLSVVPVAEQKYPSCTLFGKRHGARVAQMFATGR
jgi:hypothetical protein